MQQVITTQEQLNEFAATWVNEPIIGVDLECENNMHHYGVYITIIQISTSKHSCIIDTLALKDIKPVIDMLQNPNIEKVFHDTDFDFRILFRQYGARPKNVFDTRLAATVLGKPEVGLGALLTTYFNVQKQSKFQKVDWTKRPLSAGMIEYAISDTKYLLSLAQKLKDELIACKKLEWMQSICRQVENSQMTYQDQVWHEVKGVGLLNDIERGRAKVLYEARDQLAKKVNRPVHYVFTNKLLVEFAKSPPDFKSLNGVHPAVRANAHLFTNALATAVPMPVVKTERKRLSPAQRSLLDKLEAARLELAKKENVPPHIIASKDQLLHIVVSKSVDHLLPWQQALLKPYLS
ncbi:MAG TPA: ribonuclease D [Acidobacteriota bacterium]|nr:ribonuclease D [Acidobacteriota bacterium]